ncbi:TPA: hypothetical protein DEP21_04255 [Patescibacteria group bacterium]|nr:hypothetical protein [Candidatus Gracilibacteria bacterium]
MKLKSETIQKYLLILSLIVNIGITFYYNFLAENFSFKTYPLEYISWGITFIIIFFIILFNNKIIISNNNQNNHKKEKTIIRI